MRPIKMTIQGFGPFQRPTTIRFPAGASLNQLTGANLVEPQLGANGVGKSKLWDALSWVLYGKTVRGMRGPSVINWANVDLCKVRLWFNHNGKSYQVTRTAAPNKLTLQSKRIAPRIVQQDVVNTLLGVTWESFCTVVILGQFGQFFFDLSPTEKLKQFQDAMRLEVWNNAIDVCSTRIKMAEAKAQHAVLQRSELVGRINELTSDEAHADRYEEASCVSKIKELNKEIEVEENRLKAATALLNRAIAKEADLQKQAERNENVLVPVREELKRVRTKLDKARTARDTILGGIAAKQAAITERKLLKGTVCDTCGQPVSSKHIAASTSAWEKRLAELQSEKDAAVKQVSKYKKKLNELQDQLGKGDDFTQKQAESLAQLRQEKTEIESRRKLYQAKIDNDQQAVRTLEFTIADIRSARAARELRIKKLHKAIAKSKRATDHFNARKKRWEVLQQHFRNLRLWVVDTALSELKSLTNSYMQELGMVGWRAEFAVERESSSGGIIKGFSVLIYSPGSPNKAMPWEAYSGGESQRLRIAGTCALLSLLRNRLGINAPLEVWDECSTHLSKEGVDDLITFFKIRSRKLDLQLWVVDHSANASGQFDRQYKITKTENGSEISETR